MASDVAAAALNVGDYKPGTHPSLPPPVNTDSLVYRVRKALFGSATNVVLTLVSFYLLYLTVPPLLDWALFDATFDAASRRECQDAGDGACWAFVIRHLESFTFGFYPDAERWRPVLALLLLGLALVPLLYDKTPHRKLGMIYSGIYPIIAAWLLLGDGVLLEKVGTDQFGGFLLTLVIGVTGITLSLPIGIVLALGRQSKLPIIKASCVCFIEFIRGVPLITLLFVASTMLSYFLPPGTQFNLLLRVLIMVTLFASAYMAEVIRGGLQAIPRGQYEAADAMGLKYWQSMRLIILPQALKISIPGIVNTFIGLFKDTTLVIVIGLLDPLGISRMSLANNNWQGLSTEAYLFIAVFFFICCFGMSRYSLWLEDQLHRGHKR